MQDCESDDLEPRFLILAKGCEGADVTARRNKLLEAHRAYLNAPGRILRGILRGPLWDSAGDIRVGSIFVLQAPNRAYVEAFFVDEPSMKGGLCTDFEILPWRLGGLI